MLGCHVNHIKMEATTPSVMEREIIKNMGMADPVVEISVICH